MLSPLSLFSQEILKKPIIFNETRRELSLQYMEKRYGLSKLFPEIEPKIIVVHWTGSEDLEISHNIMLDPILSTSRTDIQKGGNLNVSAHYLISRSGDIFKMLHDKIFARHVIGLNYYSIGIENVGSDQFPLTRAQLRANVRLIKILLKKYDIEYLIGHYEYKKFVDHPLWLERDSSYLTEKIDPGKDFMKRLRKRLKMYKLSGPPEHENQ